MKFLNMQFFKSVRLSFYFAVLMSLVIIITTTLFAFYTMFNIKNLASEYESDNYKLRYSISTMLVKTFLVDNKRKDYEATLNIVDIMKKDNLLSYVYVKDNLIQEFGY